MQEKLLVLSGSLGDGHMQAAKAIVEASEICKPGMSVKVIDLMEWIHPRMHVIERYCFLQGVKHLPSLYGFLYQKTREDSPIMALLKKFRQSSLHRLMELIHREKPTVLVSTFPPASAALSLMKEKRMTLLTTVTIITDHSDHSYWIHPYTDLYLVGSQEVGEALLKKEVPLHKIVVTGIPVRPAYSQPSCKKQLREKLGLDPASFVVLVMGGGCGMIKGNFVEGLKSDQFPANVQFVFVCGRNVKLLHRLSETFQGRSNVWLKGYIDGIQDWMACADVLITKPGGLTTSEAQAVQLPMILFESTLGQERDNANYLTRKGVAVWCQEDNLPAQLKHMMENPELLQAMREKAGRSRQQHAAVQAVRQIMNLSGPAVKYGYV
ncbi:MGDG synthase family glycosyltransferase [Paenibacillus paeoniae]|uniref:Galactosyldiacylglycerol synthase n=1 Tax=Paenibacillus paeoniae TaxID=2292705 RepID=A0A371PKE8_9BACL|nr:glycosyltransferase [Paenibacillus paeoniae]REK76678.1 galactosyldiacylglycerol synthase [Paenibacillus paeoniae]